MGEVEFSKGDEYKVKMVDGGEFKEPGGGIRKPSREEIDEYRIHRIVVMVIFALVVILLLLLIVILIATTEGCKPEKKLPWYKSGVMYNIYPRSFKDSVKNDGVGDFKGIIEKLSYLKGLGVNILYLSSIFHVDKNVDYGYSVIDFKDTNSDYGTIEDFSKLVESAHEQDMKVIIDFIPAVTSTKHPWFNSSQQRKDGKEDWYVWMDNNQTSAKGKWFNDTERGQYYLHPNDSHSKANLNWTNADVQKEMESVFEFWLKKNVDGFHIVSIQNLFVGNPINGWDKIHMLVQKWHNSTKKILPDSILMGTSHPTNLELYGTNSQPELNIVVNLELVPEKSDTFYNAKNFKNIIVSYINKLKKGNWPSWTLSSLFHQRVASNVNYKLAKSLQSLLMVLPGTPIVFYGDEIGMKDVSSPLVNQVDYNKAPMQWNGNEKGGFTSSNKSWFGEFGNVSRTNVELDQLGILKTLKKALNLRKENAIDLLDAPLSNFTIETTNNVLAFTFNDKTSRFAVVLNFVKDIAKIDLENTLGIKKAQLKFYTDDVKPSDVNMKDLSIPGYALCVFQVTGKM